MYSRKAVDAPTCVYGYTPPSGCAYTHPLAGSRRYTHQPATRLAWIIDVYTRTYLPAKARIVRSTLVRIRTRYSRIRTHLRVGTRLPCVYAPVPTYTQCRNSAPRAVYSPPTCELPVPAYVCSMHGSCTRRCIRARYGVFQYELLGIPTHRHLNPTSPPSTFVYAPPGAYTRTRCVYAPTRVYAP